MERAAIITGKVSWGEVEEREGWSGQMWTERLGMENRGQTKALESRATLLKGGSGLGAVPSAGHSVLRPALPPLKGPILLS